MNDYLYSKALLIGAYSEIKFRVDNRWFDFFADTEITEWLTAIFNSIDSMCRFILLENGYEMNRKKRFTYIENGEIASSAAEIVSEVDGLAPPSIQNAINETIKMFFYTHVVGLESEEEFYPVLDLYDKFCTWFWGKTNLRESLSVDEVMSIKETFSYILPYVKGEDPYLENIVKESIKVGSNDSCTRSELQETKLTQEILQLTNEIRKLGEGINVIDKKVDELGIQIKQISHMINADQALVTRQLFLADDEREKEKIISCFTDEISEKVKDKISTQYSKVEYGKEISLLADIFGTTWDKLNSDTKKFIVSAKIMYKNQRSMGNLIDYSGVCVLVTKALELEMDIRFYGLFMEYIKKNYPGKKNYYVYPTSLLNKYGKPCKQKDFTLGTVPFTLCYKTDGLSEEQIGNNKKLLVEFCQKVLMPGCSEDYILNTLYNYGEKIEEIKNDYRNPCAHTNSLQAINAKECLDLVIDVEKLLKVMLDSFAK